MVFIDTPAEEPMVHVIQAEAPPPIKTDSRENDDDGDDDDDDDDSSYGSPESFFVFIVGVNGEWEDGRSKYGDIALTNEYVAAGVPPDQVMFVKDEQATKSNCELQLEQFLKRSRPSSTLVFYYGGHGIPTGFETVEEAWKHEDLIHLIDTFFGGDRVILLIDCCASANLCRWLQPPRTLRHTYLCLMSTLPYAEAGAAWTMTACWIQALQCSAGDLPITQVVEFLSDSTARIKGDILVVYTTKNVRAKSCSWFPRQRTSTKRQLTWKKLQDCIPSDAKVSKNCSIGDRVYYKHSGRSIKSKHNNSSGYNPASAGCIFSVWLPATIYSTNSGSSNDLKRLKLEVTEPMSPGGWNVQTDRNKLLNSLHMASTCMVPAPFYHVQCELAKHFKFYDYSLEPETPVRATGTDKQTYDAKVIDWRDIDWDAYLTAGSCGGSPPFGPHVGVHWFHNEEMTVISLERIQKVGEFNSSYVPFNETREGDGTEHQRMALIKSIESCGKTVCDAEEVLDTDKISCFWPEDGEWYDAEPLDPSSVALEVLTSHVMFTVKGPYCPVLYDDDTAYLIPLHYVRRQKTCPCFPVWQ